MRGGQSVGTTPHSSLKPALTCMYMYMHTHINPRNITLRANTAWSYQGGEDGV